MWCWFLLLRRRLFSGSFFFQACCITDASSDVSLARTLGSNEPWTSRISSDGSWFQSLLRRTSFWVYWLVEFFF